MKKDSALAAAPGSAAAHKVLLLELINPKSWLSGKRALLQSPLETDQPGCRRR